jgi:hypothetical protein
MVSGAVAFAGTLAIGAAARAYFIRGASIEDAKRAFKNEKKSAEEDATKAADADAEKKRRDYDVN